MAGSGPVERFFQTHVSETKPITAVSAGASFQGRSSGQSPAALSFRPDGARSRVAVHPTTDRKDKPLDLPLLELDQELWDREGQRLTVLFDPGRIKRGVLPRDEVGSALFEGSAYTLVIDSKWHDANGAPHSGAAGFLQRSVDRRLSLLRWIMPVCTVCSSSSRMGRVNGGITVDRQEHSGDLSRTPRGRRAITACRSIPRSKTWPGIG